MLSDASAGGISALAFTIVITFLATLVVVLRFWARNTTKFGLWLDDWLALATLVCLYWVLVLSAIAVDKGGIGKPLVQALTDDPNSATVLLQMLWVFENAYLFASPLMKLTVLAYYWRMFPNRRMRLSVWILSGICGMWFLGTFFGNLLQCAPIAKFWDIVGTAPGVCHFTATKYYVVVAIPNMVIDLATVLLPVHEIWGLQLALWKRISVCFIFLLGGIVVIASIVRLALLIQFDKKGTANVSQDLLLPWFVTVVEIGVAIIGACIPCLMPLYRKIRFGTTDSRATPGGYGASGTNAMSKGGQSRSGNVKLSSNDGTPFSRMNSFNGSREDGFDSGAGGMRTTVQRGKPLGDEESDEYPLHGITVQREVFIQETR